MWPNRLLSLSLLAIVAILSLPCISASNTVHINTERPPNSPLFYNYRHFGYNASATNEIVSEIETFHAKHFVDSRFTTEELAMYPEAKAVVEFLRAPLEAAIALGSNIELSNCEAVTRSLETCAVWSISANIDPATARPFLHAINGRVHRCVETLDKVMQQHNLLKQLMQRLANYRGFSVQSLSLLSSQSNHVAAARHFSRHAYSIRLWGPILHRRLETWNGKDSAAIESFPSIRELLAGKSEKLANVAARDDDGSAQELSVLLKDCREELSSHQW